MRLTKRAKRALKWFGEMQIHRCRAFREELELMEKIMARQGSNSGVSVRWVGDSCWSLDKNGVVSHTVVLAKDGFAPDWMLAKPVTQE